ncbi:MAG: guanylate kinase [Firmicutes bacterium]|nr:guanylate kinase [Bacillota bacterium]
MENKNSNSGLLFVVSGPSGVGKGTVLALAVKKVKNLHIAVSATTRKPRTGEENGVHYHFLSVEDFKSEIEKGGLLEFVYNFENYYGTLKREVENAWKSGKDVILEIETEGAMKIKEQMPQAVMVFIKPNDINSLRERLTVRGTETPEAKLKRLDNASKVLECAEHYDFVLINENGKAEECANALVAVINASRLQD